MRTDFETMIATNYGWTTAKDTMGNYTRFEVAYAWVGWQQCWAFAKANPSLII